VAESEKVGVAANAAPKASGKDKVEKFGVQVTTT
jgi:hypothetical protein